MRYEPLSPHDRSSIIAQVASTGEWDGTRSGARIRLVRWCCNGRRQVDYAVKPGPRHGWQSGCAGTVGAAIQEVNEIVVKARSRRGGEIMIDAPYQEVLC
jgi:hypothetical protein